MNIAHSIPRIGVSACLLGQAVRYDGQHKRDDFLNDVLAPFVTFVSACPELEVGMGVPREPVRLVAGAKAIPRATLRARYETASSRTTAAAWCRWSCP